MAFNTHEGDTITEMYGSQLSFPVHSSGLGATGGCAYQVDEELSTVGTNNEVDFDRFGCAVQGHFQRKFNELGKSSLVVEDQVKEENTAGDGDTATGVGVTLSKR